MGKYTKYYILIAIISGALGIGVGLLIKERMNAKEAEKAAQQNEITQDIQKETEHWEKAFEPKKENNEPPPALDPDGLKINTR